MNKAEKLQAVREVMARATIPHDALTVASKLRKQGIHLRDDETSSLLKELEASGLLRMQIKLTPGGGTYMYQKARQVLELQTDVTRLKLELAKMRQQLLAIARSKDAVQSSDLAKNALDQLSDAIGIGAARNVRGLQARVQELMQA